MPTTRRVRHLTALLAVAALLVTSSGPAAGAGAQPAGAARPVRAVQGRAVAVTLLTGDKVLLRQRPRERQSVQVVAARRPGARPNFEVVSVSPDRFNTFLEAKKDGATTQEAMAAIGFTGDQAYATTTEPFNTRRQKNSWNQNNAVSAGTGAAVPAGK